MVLVFSWVFYFCVFDQDVQDCVCVEVYFVLNGLVIGEDVVKLLFICVIIDEILWFYFFVGIVS